MDGTETNLVVLFDGVCHLCNSSVNFIIRHDPRKQFKFTPLQSSTGQDLLREYGLATENFETVVLIEDRKSYTRSTAALRVARRLNNLWPLTYMFIIIPQFMRDAIYVLIAKNRYKWFGKREICMMPTPDVKERFLL